MALTQAQRKNREKMDRIAVLYSQMPGSPVIPSDDGIPLYGEVEYNDHWQFCATIIEMIDRAVGQAVSHLAADHNLV